MTQVFCWRNLSAGQQGHFDLSSFSVAYLRDSSWRPWGLMTNWHHDSVKQHPNFLEIPKLRMESLPTCKSFFLNLSSWGPYEACFRSSKAHEMESNIYCFLVLSYPAQIPGSVGRVNNFWFKRNLFPMIRETTYSQPHPRPPFQSKVLFLLQSYFLFFEFFQYLHFF